MPPPFNANSRAGRFNNAGSHYMGLVNLALSINTKIGFDTLCYVSYFCAFI